MALLILTQAAKTVDIACSTLYRAIQKGCISVVSQPNGSKSIGTSELQRISGSLQRTTKPTGQHDAPQDVALLQVRIDALERENGLLRDRLDVVSQGLLEASKGKHGKSKRKAASTIHRTMVSLFTPISSKKSEILVA